MLVFEVKGKAENPEKTLSEQNQQQTQPTYDAWFGNRTRNTLVGGERSRHCAIPAPWSKKFKSISTSNDINRSLYRPTDVKGNSSNYNCNYTRER